MSNFSYHESKTILTPSQLLSLNTVPIQLIPGQPNCVIELLSIYMRFLHSTVAYNPNADGGDTFYLYQGTPSPNTCLYGGFISASGFVDQSVDMAAWGIPSTFEVPLPSTENGFAVPFSDVVGSGGYLIQADENDVFPNGANWTTGNGSLAVFLRWAYIEASVL